MSTIIRDDLSNRLIHLTRDADDQSETASDRFLSILIENKIRGSSKNIRGGHACVCFTETPISKIPMVLAQQEFRYRPFGVIVKKEWLFEHNGRPAIYQTEQEFESLTPELQYRHVRYEPGVCDYTWEREWRIKSNDLVLDPANTTLVVPSRVWSEKIQKDYVAKKQQERRLLNSRFGLFPHINFPWSIIILEDLGVEIPLDAKQSL
jgi:hypothetical protein